MEEKSDLSLIADAINNLAEAVILVSDSYVEDTPLDEALLEVASAISSLRPDYQIDLAIGNPLLKIAKAIEGHE